MLTSEEFLKYRFDNAPLDEIKQQFESVNKSDKYYESAMEQSQFRADVIEQILQVCKENPRSKICKQIQLIVENSYVEL